MPAVFPQGTEMSPETQGFQEPQDSRGTAPTSPAGRRRERDGGRHGRAAFPESAADSAIRSRLVRLAAVPCLLVAATCSAATAYVARVGGVRLTGRDGAVLLVAFVLVCGVVLVAAVLANSEARAAVTRYARLRQVCARSQSDLYDLLHRVRQGEWLQQRDPEPLNLSSGDALDLLAHEVTAAGRAAEAAVIEAVAIARSNADGNEQKVEVFVNLARRLQSLVHREIRLLDELENRVEDPDLLKGLFHVDHLATRVRRHAENLAVLGGAISRRQWSRPISMTEVLRSSVAEVEQYPRIKLVPPIEGTLRGHAVADVVHLLAELVENATVYSSPQTHVQLSTQVVTAGLAVEVEDRGLGMTADEQARMNALLDDPDHVDVDELLSDGRIGLYVVSALARRHGIAVRLRSNIYGGVQAVLVLPEGLLGPMTEQGTEDEEALLEPDEDPTADAADVFAALSLPPDERRPGYFERPNAHPAAQPGPAPAHSGANGHPAAEAPPATQGRARRRFGRAAREPAAPEPDLPAPSVPSSPLVGRAGDNPPTIARPADAYGPGGYGTDDGAGSAPSGGADTGHRRASRRHAAEPPAAEPAGTTAEFVPPEGTDPAPRTSWGTSAALPREPAAPADPGPVQLPPAPLSPADDEEDRPSLPRRRRMEHMVPQLREGPILPATRRPEDPERGHDPNLMATFRRGLSLADDSFVSIPASDPSDTGEKTGHDSPYHPGPDTDHGSGYDIREARPRGDDHNHGE
ncbi:ATP-binding protein [Streptomyces sp. NPDC003077]|uniref:ATP-binding protein n=1 Tax=Streptomyces sp. NPDC003077 TaxID=3154443 RepID=UPI0033A102FA